MFSTTNNNTKVTQPHNYNKVFYSSDMYCGQTYCSMGSYSTSVLLTLMTYMPYLMRTRISSQIILEMPSIFSYSIKAYFLQCSTYVFTTYLHGWMDGWTDGQTDKQPDHIYANRLLNINVLLKKYLINTDIITTKHYLPLASGCVQYIAMCLILPY